LSSLENLFFIIKNSFFEGFVALMLGGERTGKEDSRENLGKDLEIYSPDGGCRLTIPFSLDEDVERAGISSIYQICLR
jgi:hypothetical protein